VKFHTEQLIWFLFVTVKLNPSVLKHKTG